MYRVDLLTVVPFEIVVNHAFYYPLFLQSRVILAWIVAIVTAVWPSYAVHFDVLSILIIISFHGEEYISGTFTTAGAGHADVSVVHWRGQSVRVGARARNRVRLVSPAQAAAHLQRFHVRVF